MALDAQNDRYTRAVAAAERRKKALRAKRNKDADLLEKDIELTATQAANKALLTVNMLFHSECLLSTSPSGCKQHFVLSQAKADYICITPNSMLMAASDHVAISISAVVKIWGRLLMPAAWKHMRHACNALMISAWP